MKLWTVNLRFTNKSVSKSAEDHDLGTTGSSDSEQHENVNQGCGTRVVLKGLVVFKEMT